MHLFDYSDITVSIPSDIVDDIAAIERIRTFDPIRRDRYSKELEAALVSAVARDTETFLEIDGAPPEDRGAVSEGFSKALDEIVRGPGGRDADERTLLHIHRTLVNGTTRRESRFRYREAQDLDRAEHVRSIRTLPSDEVAPAVEQMSDSYRMARDVGVQPLLLVPCMVLDLVNVHPFPERNWEVARLLCRSLLIGGGFDALRYLPADTMLAGDLDDLYESVSESSSGWRSNGNDPFQFVRFAVHSVLGCYAEFDRRYPLDNGRKVGKAERIERIVLSSGHPLTKTEVCSALPDVSRRTADKVLGDLVSGGRIKKTGTFKDARYTRP